MSRVQIPSLAPIPSIFSRQLRVAHALLKITRQKGTQAMTMKRRTKTVTKEQNAPATLRDLCAAVYSVAQDDQISANVVAGLINSGRVRLHGDFKGKRVVVV